MRASLFATLAAAALLTATSAFAAPLPGRDGPRYELRPGDRDFNYGYAKGYRVSTKERVRWEAARRDDGRRDNDRFDRSQNYGFERDHRATPDECRRWENAHNYGYDQSHRVTP